jgi:hypothetical protein
MKIKEFLGMIKMKMGKMNYLKMIMKEKRKKIYLQRMNLMLKMMYLLKREKIKKWESKSL